MQNVLIIIHKNKANCYSYKIYYSNRNSYFGTIEEL